MCPCPGARCLALALSLSLSSLSPRVTSVHVPQGLPVAGFDFINTARDEAERGGARPRCPLSNRISSSISHSLCFSNSNSNRISSSIRHTHTHGHRLETAKLAVVEIVTVLEIAIPNSNSNSTKKQYERTVCCVGQGTLRRSLSWQACAPPSCAERRTSIGPATTCLLRVSR